MDFISVLTKTYNVEAKCNNCKTVQLTRINKGNVAEDVIQNARCIKCGCRELFLTIKKGGST